MDDAEFRWLKEEMAEIKESVKNVDTVVCDMRVLLAGNYVTKQDFEDYKKEGKVSRHWWAGFIIAVTGVITAIFNFWFR